MTTSASESPIVYRQLGKCGLRVSVPILGGMNFGHTGWGFGDWVLGEEESMTILKAAWDRGINTVDTANTYSNGISEEIVGKFLKKYNIPRHKFTIITKIINPVSEKPGEWVVDTFPGKTDPNYVNQEGLSRVAVFNATEACLRRLDTSYIDLLMIHRFDFDTPIEETMKALHDLVTSGKVRYIGASNMKTYQFVMMNECARRNGWTPFVNMQCEYSLLFREEEREMIPYCRENGIGITAWSPLAMGYLARPANVDPHSARSEANRLSPYSYLKLPGSEEIVNRLEEIAKKKQESMASVALTWALKEASSVVVGIAKVPRLDDAMVGRKTLTDEERQLLEEPYQPQKARY